jgi:probable F420-dependent oxidoreductase
MKLGIHLGNHRKALTGGRLIQLAKRAEELGFSSVWVSDHIVIPDAVSTAHPYARMGNTFDPVEAERFYEAIVTLSVVAGATSRIRVGTSVLVAAIRNPLLLAKQVATLDDLSGGRVELGLGAGWMREEFEALDADFDRRWTALEEHLQILRGAWTEGAYGFAGEVYEFGPVRVSPKPAQVGGPPITIGGHGRRAADLAGRLGDGVNVFQLSPAELQQRLRLARQAASEAGRDPSALRALVRCDLMHPDFVPTTPPASWQLWGGRDDVLEAMASYAAEGADELLLSIAPGEQDTVVDECLAWAAADLVTAC